MPFPSVLPTIATVLLLPAGTLIAHAQAPTAPEAGKWRLVRVVDELSGSRDDRIVLRSEEWRPPPKKPKADFYYGSTLIIACGDRVLADSGRSLIFYPGEAVAMYGDYPRLYGTFTFDSEAQSENLDPFVYDYRDALLFHNDLKAEEWVTYLAEDHDHYFSERIFRRLAKATRVAIRFSTGSGYRTVHFDLRGLSAAVQQLQSCRWPRP